MWFKFKMTRGSLAPARADLKSRSGSAGPATHEGREQREKALNHLISAREIAVRDMRLDICGGVQGVHCG